MAYECYYGWFSTKSDVWAFGCTMWEVFDLAKNEPYFEMADQQVVEDALLGTLSKLPLRSESCSLLNELRLISCNLNLCI